uniref:Uncharacterized protein n=1 Tax=Oryza brachyantha TaxID=4533 RepID=J3LVT9_ORYBR
MEAIFPATAHPLPGDPFTIIPIRAAGFKENAKKDEKDYVFRFAKRLRSSAPGVTQRRREMQRLSMICTFSGPDEDVILGARGKKLRTRECGWCHMRDGHYANTCPKNPTNFAKKRKVANRGKGKRGRPRGGRARGHGTNLARAG